MTGICYRVTSSSGFSGWSVNWNGDMDELAFANEGIRPVIVLKAGIRTNGRTIDKVGQEAWSLVAP